MNEHPIYELIGLEVNSICIENGNLEVGFSSNSGIIIFNEANLFIDLSVDGDRTIHQIDLSDQIIEFKFGRNNFIKINYSDLGFRCPDLFTITLAKNGLDDDFERTESVQSGVSRVINQAKTSANPRYSSNSRFSTNVTWNGSLFSLGNGQVATSVLCGASSCSADFRYRDWFQDPLDLGVEVGGAPYRINHDWSVQFRY